MQDQKIYVKHLETLDPYTVWLVRGEYIRQHINENFVEYDEHYHLPFIPKNELWIDEHSHSSEWPFFIDHMVYEKRLIEQGAQYEEAMKKSDAREKRERAKALNTSHRLPKHESEKDKLEKIHKNIFMNQGELTVWIVNGKAVRDIFSVEYADGGHDLVYDFIPKNEIWLEDCLGEHEMRFILLHELHERLLMSEGKDYAHAHKGATIVEDYYRDHPKHLSERLKEELDRNTANMN